MPFVEVSQKAIDFYRLLMAGLAILYSVLCKFFQNLSTSQDFSSCLIMVGRRYLCGPTQKPIKAFLKRNTRSGEVTLSLMHSVHGLAARTLRNKKRYL